MHFFSRGIKIPYRKVTAFLFQPQSVAFSDKVRLNPDRLCQMIKMKKAVCFLLSGILTLLCVFPAFSAQKAQPTPTPPPIEIREEIVEPPEQIREVLDIAYGEWTELGGKVLKKANKFTKWRTSSENGFGWCGGFITWCMIQAGINMDTLDVVKKNGEGPVDGIYHVKEASVGKLLRGYQIVQRAGIVPQKGYLLVYGVRKSSNKTVHIGLVWDVQDLGSGKYRLTTIEGNIGSRIMMYIHDYDMFAEDPTKNLSLVPEDERSEAETRAFSYKLADKNWYVNRFLMPWLPSDIPAEEPEEPAEEIPEEVTEETTLD